jgi:hypothetical protein
MGFQQSWPTILESTMPAARTASTTSARKTTGKRGPKGISKTAKARGTPRPSAGQKRKTEKVMEEFKEGKLKSGPKGKGGKVKSRKQAIAIAMSESGQSTKKKSTKKTAPASKGGTRSSKPGPKKGSTTKKQSGPKKGSTKKTTSSSASRTGSRTTTLRKTTRTAGRGRGTKE